MKLFFFFFSNLMLMRCAFFCDFKIRQRKEDLSEVSSMYERFQRDSSTQRNIFPVLNVSLYHAIYIIFVKYNCSTILADKI